jgi:hypothetical protein
VDAADEQLHALHQMSIHLGRIQSFRSAIRVIGRENPFIQNYFS